MFNPNEVLQVQENTLAESGFVPFGAARRRPEFTKRLQEVAQLYARAYRGDVVARARFLQEAMTTSDFPLLMGDITARQLLKGWQERRAPFERFMKVSTVPDLRSVKRFRVTGGTSVLEHVAESEDYPADKLDEAYYEFSVQKYGRVFHISLEALLNDDLGAFNDLPARMVAAVENTLNYVASSLYVANATLFGTHAVNGTNYTNKGTAALSWSALKAAYEAMVAFPSENGYPLMNQPRYLVVPPQLELTARSILDTNVVAWGGSTNVPQPDINVLRGKLEVIVDPMIPVIDTTNGATSWYLFADPNNIHAVEVAYLAGAQQPQLYVQSSGAVSLTGSGGPYDGGFANDTIGYKVRIFFGGSHANAVGGWRAAYWSDGTV